MSRLRLLPALATALLLGSAQAATYTIDVLYNVTGENKASARAAWRGAKVAAVELNKMHIPVKLRLYDGQSEHNMDHAIAVMQAKHSKSPIMIGLTRSDDVMDTALPLTQANKLFINTSSASEQTQKALGDHYIMTAFTTEQEAKKSAHFLHNTMHQDNLYILVEPTTSNQQLAKALSGSFGDLGGKPTLVPVPNNVNSSQADEVANNLRQQLTDSTHTVIYLATNTKTAAKLLEALRDQDIVNTVMTSARFSPRHIQSMKHKQVAPFFYTSHAFFDTNNPSQELKQFKQAYRKHYHQDPLLPETALGYDAVMLAGYAIAHSPTYTDKDLRNTLRKLNSASMVTGHLNLTNPKAPVDKIAIVGIGNDLKGYQVDRGSA